MDNLYKAPAVMAFRLPMIWMNAVNPTAAGQREMDRMVTEKVDAAWAGWAQANQAAAMGAITFWTSLWFGKTPYAAAQVWADAVSAAALAPARRTVGANARRLSRRKRL